MQQNIRVAVAGANGRMGRVLVEAVGRHPDTVLSGALEHAGSEALGLDAGYAIGVKTGVPISSDIAAVLADSAAPGSAGPEEDGESEHRQKAHALLHRRNAIGAPTSTGGPSVKRRVAAAPAVWRA